ncbi:MAG: T9SS type A sorting domain-containing protein [Bacteroidota bacterium]
MYRALFNRLWVLILLVFSAFSGHTQIVSLDTDFIQVGRDNFILINNNGTITTSTTVELQHPTHPNLPGAVANAGGSIARVIFSPPISAPTGAYTLVTTNPSASWPVYVGTMNDVAPDTVMAGSTFSLLVTGTDTRFSSATGAWLAGINQVFPDNMTGPYAPATSIQVFSDTVMTANFTLPTNFLPGNYWYATGSALNQRIKTVRIEPGPGGPYAKLFGYIGEDLDNNCVFSPWFDSTSANRRIKIQPGNDFVIADVSGRYEKWLLPGAYTATLMTHLSETDLCNTFVRNFNITSGNNVPHSFMVDTTAIHDVCVTMQTPFFRPGFQGTAVIYVSNPGNRAVQNVGLDVTFPSFWTNLSSLNSPFTITGNTMHWDLGTMLPAETRTYYISGMTPAMTPLGTNALMTASITPTSNDAVPFNNQFTVPRVVTGSYDPNDKQVFTADGQNADGGIEPSDTLLYYFSRFQNTGTDTAFNVSVRDTLDPNLNWASFQSLGTSHAVNILQKPDGAVEWFFPNILLPDSNTNEPRSHGWISYAIRLEQGLAQGTTIENTASIYFDFNAPIVTNTVASTICTDLGLSITHSLSGYTVNLTGMATGDFDSLWWDLGDGTTSTQAALSHTYANPGFYTACYFARNNCGVIRTECVELAVDTIYISTLPGIFPQAQLSCFPNPTNDLLNIHLASPNAKVEQVNLALFDAVGKRVWEKMDRKRSETETWKVDVHNFDAGIYFLRLRVGDATLTRRISIQ